MKQKGTRIEPAPARSPLSDEKLAVEIEKLRVEVGQLKRPAWFTPTTVIAVVSLIVSLASVFLQSWSARRAAELAEDRWRIERQKITVELDAMRNKTGASATDRAEVLSELGKVKQSVDTLAKDLVQDRTTLMEQQVTLQMWEHDGNAGLANFTRMDITNTLRRIAFNSNELSAATARRSELEKRLSGQ